MHHLNSRSVLEHVNYRKSHAHVEMMHVEMMSGLRHMNMSNGEDQSGHNICNSASSKAKSMLTADHQNINVSSVIELSDVTGM